MTESYVEDVAKCLHGYGASEELDEQKRRWVCDRIEIVEYWSIQPGWRVLEIGCGNGWMTVALAGAVGDTGHVTAVDIDPHDPSVQFPSPSMGEETDVIKASWLGPRIDFLWETDLLDPTIHFEADSFDMVVLNHSSWYFRTPSTLAKLLDRVHPWAKELGYHEWDLRPRSMSQVPHMLAALIQAQLKTIGLMEQKGGIWSLILPEAARRMAESAGWHVVEQREVTSSHQREDGIEWEPRLSVEYAEEYLRDSRAFPSVHTRQLLATQVELLKELNLCTEHESLSTFVFRAERASAVLA